MKITRPTTIAPGIYAHVCPLCGQVLADACEAEMLPEFSICPCDRNGNKAPVYETYRQDGAVMIRRNKPPRFTARVAFDGPSDLADVRFSDEASPDEYARALRKASEYLAKQASRY